MATDKKPKIAVTKNGPYMVTGEVPLAKAIMEPNVNGDPVAWKKGDAFPNKKSYALCRCGNSKTKPYCDGSHVAAKFDGTETASKAPYSEQARTLEGSDLVLTDAGKLCSGARFCHRAGGIWKLTEESADPESKKTAIQEACDCPSGRLVVWDKKTGKAIEPKFEPSINLAEDPCKKVSGPICVKGGIELESSDGSKYETRNRVTLCRCGKSGNKPFCDGSHISSGFNDGDHSLK